MKHKISIIGFGGMGKWHSQKVLNFTDVEVAGVWDIKEEARATAAERHLYVYESLEALLEDETTDLVIIATPNDVHRTLAIAAMREGKHVICEKPVTLCSEDLEAMEEVSRETGRFLTVHQNRRWDQDFQTVKKIIEKSTLGEIFRIESRVHGSRGIPGDWRQEKDKGGGMVLDWGVHLLDQALLFFPGVKVSSVYGTLHHITNQKVDDGFTADICLENGVHIYVEVGTSNFISLPRWYVLGVDGTALIEDWKLNGKIIKATGVNEKDVVPVVTAAGLTKTMAPRRDDTILTEELPKVESDVLQFYQNVLDVIEGKAESLIRLDEVKRVMRLMEAVFESATTGKVVLFE